MHTVFTLPHELNTLGRRYPSALYNLLMRSAWKTVKRLSSDSDNIGGLPGMISVLHTFGSDMKYHLHVHCLITFGGLDKSVNWVWPKKKNKLASYREMCKEYRKEFLSGMEKLISKGKVKVSLEWDAIRSIIEKKRWECEQYVSDDGDLLDRELFVAVY